MPPRAAPEIRRPPAFTAAATVVHVGVRQRREQRQRQRSVRRDSVGADTRAGCEVRERRLAAERASGSGRACRCRAPRVRLERVARGGAAPGTGDRRGRHRTPAAPTTGAPARRRDSAPASVARRAVHPAGTAAARAGSPPASRRGGVFTPSFDVMIPLGLAAVAQPPEPRRPAPRRW